MGSYELERIRKRVDDYVNNKWHSKVSTKSITMVPVKDFLQNIVNEKFNNAKEAKKW